MLLLMALQPPFLCFSASCPNIDFLGDFGTLFHLFLPQLPGSTYGNNRDRDYRGVVSLKYT
jgi:hypothetical protein